MGFKRTLQLSKIKDKISKRYIIRYSFFRNNNHLFEQRIDITDLIKERGWKSISFGEAMEISQIFFGTTFGKYPLISESDEKGDYWKIYEIDGFSIGLSQEDLAMIRNRRIESLGL